MVMGETVIKITEPLLKTHPSRDDDYGSKKKKAVSTDLSSDRIEEYLGQENLPSEWWALLIGWELRQLWSLCGLCIIISVFNLMLSLVTQMFIGHYMGSLKLAGASIAILEIQGFAFIIMTGMAIAVQSLCGEAFEAKKYDSLGTICQQAIILHLGTAVVLSSLYWYSGTILQTFGLWAAIADQSQIVARGLLPQLFAYALNFPLQRFLQAQNIVNPLVFTAVGIFFLHLLLNWVVVDVLNYGLMGAALTLSFSWWLQVIIILIYIIFSPSCEKTWTGFSTKAFKGIWSYSKIAFSSLFVLSFESWFSIGLVLSAGFFASPAVSIASFAICLNYLHLDLAFMLGVCTAASIRVGGELEGAHPTVAKFSAVVANCNSLLISLIFCAIVLLYGATLSKAFTSDIEVIKAVSDFSPLLAFSIFLNGIEPILSGVAIGAGRAGFVVCSYACNYYLVGLGVGYGIAFMTNFGVSGIWWGVILGFLLQTITLVVLAIRINWNKESEKLTRNDRKRIRNKFISVVALIKWKRLYEQTRLPVSTE